MTAGWVDWLGAEHFGPGGFDDALAVFHDRHALAHDALSNARGVVDVVAAALGPIQDVYIIASDGYVGVWMRRCLAVAIHVTHVGLPPYAVGLAARGGVDLAAVLSAAGLHATPGPVPGSLAVLASTFLDRHAAPRTAATTPPRTHCYLVLGLAQTVCDTCGEEVPL